mgnify:CR=1 FL=1
MTFNKQIFREYDIRGIANVDLKPPFAKTLGLAYAKMAFNNTNKSILSIGVGQDCRLSSDSLTAELISGLREGGMNVFFLGTCPTPLTYFSTYHLNLDGNIMITGSHNAPDYNGFKMTFNQKSVFGEQIQTLYKIMQNDLSSSRTQGNLAEHLIVNDYIDNIVPRFKNLAPLKVVLDAGNGTASTVAPEVFSKIGAKVIPLFCELDGNFPNHHPDPTVPKNLNDLILKVKEEKADIGFAFDGDADRIGVVNELGEIIYGDELMVLLSRAVLKEIPNATIISEVKSSTRLYDDISQNGGNAIMWKTGHSIIKTKMKETNAALAGEMSGHIFFADRYYGYDDAIYAALRVYEIVAKTKKPLSSLLSDLPKAFNTPEIRVECDDNLKFELVEKAKKVIRKDYKINDLDGVRVEFDFGWGLIRASNTQPALVLRFEATCEQKLLTYKSIIRKVLDLCAKEVGHEPVHFE